MTAEESGADYKTIYSSTTLIAGVDFPVDRYVVMNVIGGGGGGRAGGHGWYKHVDSSGYYPKAGFAGGGGSNGQIRTVAFEKNTIAVGTEIIVTIGAGGLGGVAWGRVIHNGSNTRQYGLIGTDGNTTSVIIGGTLYEANGGAKGIISKNTQTAYSEIVSSNGLTGFDCSKLFNDDIDKIFSGGIGGIGGRYGGVWTDNAVGKYGANGGYGCGGGGGGGGNCEFFYDDDYPILNTFEGGGGGNGGNGFVCFRWSDFRAPVSNKENFQPSFFEYSPDIGDCFYGHTQQKMLAVSSYKRKFVELFELAIKATNGGALYTTVNGIQCYNHIGDIGTTLLGGGTNAQNVSNFLQFIGYTSANINEIISIASNATIKKVNMDFSNSFSFREPDLQFIIDGINEYFVENEIIKIEITHKENSYCSALTSMPTSGLSILNANVTKDDSSTGIIKYESYLKNGQYCYAPESYFSELGNLIFKKSDNTIVDVPIEIRKASLGLMLISANSFLTPISSPVVVSTFSIDTNYIGLNVKEEFQINIIPNFGEIEFTNYAVGTNLASESSKIEDRLNYMTDATTYRGIYCNLVWSARAFVLNMNNGGILVYGNGDSSFATNGVYISVNELSSTNILEILYTLSQIVVINVVKKKLSLWKSLISGILSFFVTVLTQYVAPIFGIVGKTIGVILSYAWKELVPPSYSVNENNSYGVEKTNISDEMSKEVDNVNFFDAEEQKTKSLYNPYIEIRAMNESQYIQYNKKGKMWQQL